MSPDRIGYLDPVDEQNLTNPGTTAGKGIAAGAASGAVIGGLLAAAAVALIPGVGPGLVGGALLPVGLGTVGGAAGGGTMGGLLGAESSEEEPYFMQEVQSGRILVSAEAQGDETGTEELLMNSGAPDVDRLRAA